MSTIKATNFQHASATNPAIVLAADGSATANVSSINGGPLAGMRNAIINGNFDIWQRGTSFTLAEYGADRWLNASVGSTHTATRQAFTLGQTAVPGEPTYFCRTVVVTSSGASNFAILVQRIEDVRTFAGQQVTVSFWAKVDSTKNIAVELVQDFGTGGSPSAQVRAIGTTKVSIGTSWQKVTVTATVPSISGKTLGTNGDSYLALTLWFDAGSDWNTSTDSLGQQSGTFDIAQVQVEPGPVATPFERRPIGTELALCQRYYERMQPRNSICYFQAGNSAHIYVPWKVIKRTTPSIAFLNTTSNKIVFGSSGSTTFNGTYGIEGQNTYGTGANATTSTSVLTAGQAGRFQVPPIITAESEL